jgi:hypothetical protein
MPVQYQSNQPYQYVETRKLVQLVYKAAELVHLKGEAAFSDFRSPGSQCLPLLLNSSRRCDMHCLPVNPPG